MFKHFKNKADLERAIKTSISQTGGAFQKEFSAILKNYTGQTLGGGATAAIANANNYANPNFATGGRPAGGHQTTVGSRNTKYEKHQSIRNSRKEIEKAFQNLLPHNLNYKYITGFGSPNISGQYRSISYAWSYLTKLQAKFDKVASYGIDPKTVAFKGILTHAEFGAAGMGYGKGNYAMGGYQKYGRYVSGKVNANLDAVIREQERKQRQAKHTKLSTYASTITNVSDLSQLGLSGITEVEALSKEFGNITTHDKDGISFVDHLKALEEKRIAEQKAMQEEIRRIAAEQKRIKEQQEWERKQRERWASLTADLAANPYDVLNILTRHGISRMGNIKHYLDKYIDLSEEQEAQILKIAQIGQRAIMQQVST